MRICGWRNIRGQQPLASNMAKKKTAIKKTVATEPRTYVRIPLVREVDAEVGPFRDQSAAEEWLMSRGFQKLKGVAWPFKHWDKKKKNKTFILEKYKSRFSFENRLFVCET